MQYSQNTITELESDFARAGCEIYWRRSKAQLAILQRRSKASTNDLGSFVNKPTGL